MIRCENVSKIYKGGVAALRDVSADVQNSLCRASAHASAVVPDRGAPTMKTGSLQSRISPE